MAWAIEGTSHRPHDVNVLFDWPEKGVEVNRRQRRLAEIYDPPIKECVRIAEDDPGLFHSGASEKKRKTMPDLIRQGIWKIVSDRFRSIVEDLEPGIHQFIPFELRNGKRGEPEFGPYFLLNILQCVECVDTDHTTGVAGQIPPGTRIFSVSFADDAALTIVKDSIRGRHLWRDPRENRCFFVSDDAKARFVENRLKGLEAKQAVEL